MRPQSPRCHAACVGERRHAPAEHGVATRADAAGAGRADPSADLPFTRAQTREGFPFGQRGEAPHLAQRRFSPRLRL